MLKLVEQHDIPGLTTQQLELKNWLLTRIRQITSHLATLEDFELQLQQAQCLSLFYTLLHHLDPREHKTIRKLFKADWAVRFDIDIINSHTRYGKNLNHLLKKIAQEVITQSYDENDVDFKSYELIMAKLMESESDLLTCTLPAWENFVQQQAALHKADWQKIKTQLELFTSKRYHLPLVLGRRLLPRFLNIGDRYLYQALYHLDIFYGREALQLKLDALLSKTEQQSDYQKKFTILHEGLMESLITIQVLNNRPLSASDKNRLRKLKLALNHFGERYGLTGCIKALSSQETSQLAANIPSGHMPSPGSPSAELTKPSATELVNGMTNPHVQLMAYQRVSRFTISREKQRIRHGKKIAYGISFGLSAIVAPGQGLLDTSGVVAVLTNTANVKFIISTLLVMLGAAALLPLLPVAAAILVAAIFIAGTVCNFQLYRQDLYETLVDLFVKRKFFKELSTFHKVLTIGAIGFCLAAALGFGVLTGVAVASVLTAIPFAIPTALIVTAAVIFAAVTTVCCFGIFYRSSIYLIQSKLPSTIKALVQSLKPSNVFQQLKNQLPAAGPLSYLKFALRLIITGTAIVLGTAIAIVSTVAAVSVIQLAVNQFVTASLAVTVNNNIAKALDGFAKAVSYGLALLSAPSNFIFTLKTSMSALSELLDKGAKRLLNLFKGFTIVKRKSASTAEESASLKPKLQTRIKQGDVIYIMDKLSHGTYQATMGGSILANALAMGLVEDGSGKIAEMGDVINENVRNCAYVGSAIFAAASANMDAVYPVPCMDKRISPAATNPKQFFSGLSTHVNPEKAATEHPTATMTSREISRRNADEAYHHLEDSRHLTFLLRR